MADLPAPDHALDLAYYLDWTSFYGNDRPSILGVVNALIIWAYYFTADAPGLADLDASFANAVSAGKTIYFSPNLSPADGTMTADALAGLDVAVPYWASVAAVVFDEPGGSAGTKSFVEGLLASWATALSDRSLATVPVWVNFDGAALRNSAADASKLATGIDVMGCEAYLDPALQNQPNIAALMTAEVQALKGLIDGTDPGRDKFIVIQGYNRNGLWTNLESLRNIQTPPYLEAYSDSTVQALFIFSWERPGGTQELPDCIRTEHERIWGAINSSTQPATISCSSPPPFHSGRKLYLGRQVADGDFGYLYWAIPSGSDDSKVLVYNKWLNSLESVAPAPLFTLVTVLNSVVTSIAVGPDGRVYVLSNANGGASSHIYVFESDGSAVFDVGITMNTITTPMIRLSEDGATLYVCGSGTAEGDPVDEPCLRSFSAVDGSPIDTWQISDRLAIVNFVVLEVSGVTTLFWLGPGSTAFEPVDPDGAPPPTADGIHRHNLDTDTPLSNLVTDSGFFQYATWLAWTDLSNGGRFIVSHNAFITSKLYARDGTPVTWAAGSSGYNELWVEGTSVWSSNTFFVTGGPVYRNLLGDFDNPTLKLQSPTNWTYTFAIGPTATDVTYRVSVYNADDLTPHTSPTLFSISGGSDGRLAYPVGNIVEGPLTPASNFGRVAFFSGPTSGNARVYIYEANGTFVRSFDSGCTMPTWMWYGADGTIWIAEDTLNGGAADQLQRFTEGGLFMQSWTIDAAVTIQSFIASGSGSLGFQLDYIDGTNFPNAVKSYNLTTSSPLSDIALSFAPSWLGLMKPLNYYSATVHASDVLRLFDSTGASQGIFDPDLGETAQGQMKGRFLWFKTFASPVTDDVVIRCTKCDPDVVAATLSPNPTVDDDAFFFLVTGANEVILPCPGPPPVGTVYAMRRLRRFSLPFDENKNIFLSRIEFICQTGIGNAESPDPVIWMRLSKDGGQTYGPMQQMALGQVGQYFKRVFLNRLGRGRNFVVEVSTMSPNAIGLLDCNIEATPGTS